MTSILLETPLTPDQRECALTVQRSAESLLTVINDILDFSKIEAGKFSLDSLDFAAIPEIEDAATLVAEAAASKHLSLVCDLDPTIPRLLRGDPGRLRQIVVNLLANAIKFTHAGEVRLSVEVVRRQGQQVRLRFEVADTGIGIPEAGRQKLFRAFVQVDGTTTRNYEGTGLGLAISKQLVELMNGQIGFTSEIGVGSVFWFEIEVGVAAEIFPTDGILLKGMSAFLVDAHLASRQALARTLQAWGVDVQGASDATALLRDLPTVDVVLLDSQLPASEQSEIHQRFANVVTLAPLSRGLARPAQSAILSKPFRRQTLFHTLARLCGQVDLAATAPEWAPESLPRSMSVLVAEDNPVNQLVIRRMLERLGQRCTVVSDGVEAIAAVQQTTYDLILMDCQMPRVDGFEATAAIRALPGPRSQIPIIAVTANAMNGTRELCLSAGMTGHLAKPIRILDLAETLRGVHAENVVSS